MKYIKLFEEWLAEKGQPFLFEGGAAGHMNHPYDDKQLTFGDFKRIIDAGLRGELHFDEQATEKVDGQNLFVTVKDGNVLFARNKGELKNPLTLKGIEDKFKNHPSATVKDTFNFAAEDLSKQLKRLSPSAQNKFFNNGKDFMNMEIVYSLNPNVINYDSDFIQFHGVQETDGNGNITGSNSKYAKDLVKILKRIEAHYGDTFEIVPPKVIRLKRDEDFSKNKNKFINKINKLQDQYKLKDSDPVMKYHEMWWTDLIDKEFSNLPDHLKIGLMLRWAYGDKKTLNMRKLSDHLSQEQIDKIKKFDKEDYKLKQKENIRPFEDLFLELGSVIIKNAYDYLTPNPSKEAQRLRSEISKEAKNIKRGDNIEQIKKVEDELARLQRIGGIESIYPTEGIVFKYKDKIYKLTGTFAAINKLLGIIKYGR